jgi:flagellar hook-associated protein 2
MKVSSSSSSSSTSSLGNTSLQGFGGLVSGLDRDSLIEQLTSGTQTKITKQNQEITKTEWKQEAIQSISGKVIDLEDTYLTLTGTSSIKYSDLYAKSVVTPQGDDDATKYVSASGVSDMTEYLHIAGVAQTASAATVVSTVKGAETSLAASSVAGKAVTAAITPGTSKLEFGYYQEPTDATKSNGTFVTQTYFTFPTEYYSSKEGKTITIDYTGDTSKLVEQLNGYLEENSVTLDATSKAKLKFALSDDGKLSVTSDNANAVSSIRMKYDGNESVFQAMGVDTSSSAITDEVKEKGMTISAFNSAVTEKLSDTISKEQNMVSYLQDKKLAVTLSGESHMVNFIDTDSDAFKNYDASADTDGTKGAELIRSQLQSAINEAFGSGKITVSLNQDNGLTFAAADSSSNLAVSASSAEVNKNLGIVGGASTRISTSSSLYANRTKLGFSESITEEELNEKLSNLTINGTKISGINSDTTVTGLMKAINSSDAGVRVSYSTESNQFTMIAKKTGSGRTIDLGDLDSAASIIFGSSNTDKSKAASLGYAGDGNDAVLYYNYGNGINQKTTSSTNTFSIDGLTVKVSGAFGTSTEQDGSVSFDTSKEVTFTTSANVDSVTEKVKKFITDYNAIVKAVNTEVRTKPDSSYTPLTDAQKEEMTESQITKWEAKAKEGILYSDTNIRDFSDSLQEVFSNLLGQGYDYEDLKKIGITFSDDYADGGIINFDEGTFKSAMQSDPDLVSDIIAGDGGSKTGLAKTIEDTLTPYATRYATRNGGSYGKLIAEAGSSKLVLSTRNNEIYTSLQTMNTALSNLKTLLSTEQNRYITQFTSLEETISNLNTQSSYLSGFSS